MVDNLVVVFVITGTMTYNSGLDLHQPHSVIEAPQLAQTTTTPENLSTTQS